MVVKKRVDNPGENSEIQTSLPNNVQKLSGIESQEGSNANV